MEKYADTIFETERLRVRRFTAHDYDNYFALQGNPAVMQYIRPARTREEADQFLCEKILSADNSDFKGYWAVDLKENNLFVGCFVIIPLPEDPEKTQLGYSYLPEHWGNGYATEVAIGGVGYFYQSTPLEEIYAVTETMNLASQRVLLKAGFQPHSSRKEEEKELYIFILRRNKDN